MRSHTRILPVVLSCLALCALILDSKTALSGASEGLELCFRTVIPSLFPFFVVSIFLSSLLTCASFLKPVSKALKLPAGGEVYFLLGMLGGYPVGARCVAQACTQGKLSRQDGERMLGFCSNAGPAFLFGMGASVLPSMEMCFLVWGIHILSSILVGAAVPAAPAEGQCHREIKPISLSDALQQAIMAMAQVCGWVVVMRVVMRFMEQWFLWMLPSDLRMIFAGLLELSNGVCGLKEIPSLAIRFTLFSVFLSFGGICVLLQTKSVLQGSSLTGTQYFPGKVMQASWSLILSAAALPMVDPGGWRPAPLLLGVTGCGILMRLLQIRSKNSSRNLRTCRV